MAGGPDSVLRAFRERDTRRLCTRRPSGFNMTMHSLRYKGIRKPEFQKIGGFLYAK